MGYRNQPWNLWNTIFTAELPTHQIRVNAISAGIVEPDALRHFPNQEELIQTATARAQTGRLTPPGDGVNVVVFLCTSLFSRIQEQTIIVDGGVSILGNKKFEQKQKARYPFHRNNSESTKGGISRFTLVP